MGRRACLRGLALGAIAMPRAAGAQRGGKVYRIGALPAPVYLAPFVDALRDLGWREGPDFALEPRFTGDTPEAMGRAARELAALNAGPCSSWFLLSRLRGLRRSRARRGSAWSRQAPASRP